MRRVVLTAKLSRACHTAPYDALRGERRSHNEIGILRDDSAVVNVSF